MRKLPVMIPIKCHQLQWTLPPQLGGETFEYYAFDEAIKVAIEACRKLQRQDGIKRFPFLSDPSETFVLNANVELPEYYWNRLKGEFDYRGTIVIYTRIFNIHIRIHPFNQNSGSYFGTIILDGKIHNVASISPLNKRLGQFSHKNDVRWSLEAGEIYHKFYNKLDESFKNQQRYRTASGNGYVIEFLDSDDTAWRYVSATTIKTALAAQGQDLPVDTILDWGTVCFQYSSHKDVVEGESPITEVASYLHQKLNVPVRIRKFGERRILLGWNTDTVESLEDVVGQINKEFQATIEQYERPNHKADFRNVGESLESLGKRLSEFFPKQDINPVTNTGRLNPSWNTYRTQDGQVQATGRWVDWSADVERLCERREQELRSDNFGFDEVDATIEQYVEHEERRRSLMDELAEQLRVTLANRPTIADHIAAVQAEGRIVRFDVIDDITPENIANVGIDADVIDLDDVLNEAELAEYGHGFMGGFWGADVGTIDDEEYYGGDEDDND